MAKLFSQSGSGRTQDFPGKAKCPTEMTTLLERCLVLINDLQVGKSQVGVAESDNFPSYYIYSQPRVLLCLSKACECCTKAT